MKINKTDIEDMIHLTKRDELNNLFNQIRTAIEQGETVYIERQYSNAAADIDCVLNTEEEAEAFIESWNISFNL